MTFYLTAKQLKIFVLFLPPRAIAINSILKVREGRYTKVKEVFCGYYGKNFQHGDCFGFFKIDFCGCGAHSDRRSILGKVIATYLARVKWHRSAASCTGPGGCGAQDGPVRSGAGSMGRRSQDSVNAASGSEVKHTPQVHASTPHSEGQGEWGGPRMSQDGTAGGFRRKRCQRGLVRPLEASV